MIIVLIGVVGGIAATYSALEDILDPSGFTPPCYVRDVNPFAGNSTH